MKDTVDFAKEREGLIIILHPYMEYGLGAPAKCLVDAIKTLNGSAPPRINRLAENLPEK